MKDIFISYKNDGEGNNFDTRHYDDLENLGYEYYKLSYEHRVYIEKIMIKY